MKQKKTARDVLNVCVLDFREAKSWREELEAIDTALKELRRLVPKKESTVSWAGRMINAYRKKVLAIFK